jgi:hypothetical protein
MKVTMLFCRGKYWKTVARGLSLCSTDARGAIIGEVKESVPSMARFVKIFNCDLSGKELIGSLTMQQNT